MSFNLGTAIGSIAPTLATMLGGPLAGTAVSALTGAFGLTPSGSQSQDAAAITQVLQGGALTPDVAAAVRAADQKHAELIGQQGLDLAKLNADHAAALAQIAAADVDSARKREEVVRDKTPATLAYIIILGFFLISISEIVGLVVWPEQVAKIPQAAWLLVGTIFGYLAAEAKAAAGYYFGSSAGSQSKDATIDKALNSPG